MEGVPACQGMDPGKRHTGTAAASSEARAHRQTGTSGRGARALSVSNTNKVDADRGHADHVVMDEFAAGLLLLLAVVGGWVLGVVGFFSARRALHETKALRHQLAQLMATRDTHAVPTPETAPMPLAVADQPSPEPVPADLPQAGSPQIEPLETESPWIEPPSVEPPEPAPPPPIPARPARPDLETLLTTRWGVWLGSAALLMAGVFLIRYAVDEGLLGPGPRCVLAGLLGLSLIGGADFLCRRRAAHQAALEVAAPGLAAGGVAVLFAAAYGAGALYGLVPPLFGFVLMAAVSLTGLALSLRHGRLVAAVGIVGAFATPALVQTEAPSLPGLFGYLLFVTAAALAVVRYTAWVWFGWATTFAGALWVLLAILDGPATDSWAPALFVPAATALNLLLLPTAALNHAIGRRLAWVPAASLGVVGLLLALVVGDWPTRLGVLLLGPVMVAKAASEPRLRLLPVIPIALFLALLAGWSIVITDWPDVAVPDGAWTPAVVQTLMATAALVAGLYAAAGLWGERRAFHPLAWSSLTAAVPVLTLAVCYARVEAFRPKPSWAAVALLLAAALVGVAAAALREGGSAGRPRAGTHAAGAVAALGLGFAMLLTDQWLSVAIALLLPALAWIESAADLPPLRQVALAVAAVVLTRLLLNWYVLDYAFGGLPVLNSLLAAYGAPAASFALSAAWFRRRGDDLTVGVLEAGSVAFATVLVALEIHQFTSGGDLTVLPDTFGEAALHVASLAVVASVTMRVATRLQRPVLHYGWRIQGVLALTGAIVLLFTGPLVIPATVGTSPVLDSLLPAYLLPAALAVIAMRHPATATPTGLRPVLGGYAVLAGLVWITSEIRHLFHTDMMSAAPVDDAELWAWSGAWLAYGACLMAIGIGLGARNLRLAALGIIGLTAAKVFLVDMSDLVGLWRVLSFLGLGLTLIGLGAGYRQFAGGQRISDETT